MHRLIAALALAITVTVPIPRYCSAAEYLDLPAGVTHIALPPGAVKIEYTVKNKKPLLRISVGNTAVVAQSVFFGDGKSAAQYEATKAGIHRPHADGSEGPLDDGEIISEPGSTEVRLDGGLPVARLKPGSVYITTPSVTFEFGPAAKPKK